MRILAIDIGTSCGWALGSELDDVIYGAEDFGVKKRVEGAGMRFMRAKKWLTDILFEPIDAVYFEEVRQHNGVAAAHIYGGFQAVFTQCCEEFKVPYSSVPVGTWKRALCMTGAAGKNTVMRVVREGLGFDPPSQDAADAIGIWYHGRFIQNAQVYDPRPLPQFWKELQRAGRSEAAELCRSVGLKQTPKDPIEYLKALRDRSAL